MASSGTNLLRLPFKATRTLPELSESFVKHVAEVFDTTHPDTIRDDAVEFSQLRTALFGQQDSGIPDVHPKVLRTLLLYYAQITFAITKFPLDVSAMLAVSVCCVESPITGLKMLKDEYGSSEYQLQIGVSFPWLPIFSASYSPMSVGAFSSSSPIALPSLQYERLCVLYNIAALYCALGAQSKRIDEEGFKSSIAAFQSAAGVLNHLLTLLPLAYVENGRPGPSSQTKEPPSPDLTEKVIKCFRDLCLAQAQEVFWQKSVMDRLKNGTVAKLALQTSEWYDSAASKAKESTGGGGHVEHFHWFSMPDDFVNHISMKKLHFSAVAQYRKSVDDLGANKYGDEIGRLEIAESDVKKALALPRRSVSSSVVADLKSLSGILADNRTRAVKDNNLIYLQGVPVPSSLPAITPAALAKAVIPPEILNPISFLHLGSGGLGKKPLFETLVPYEVHLAISVYDDRRETMLRDDITARQAELDEIATACLQSLNLPGSINAATQPIGLAPSLLEKSREVRAHGGVVKVKGMMQDVRKVAGVDRQILNEAIYILEQEESSDDGYPKQYGTDRWLRVPSSVANSQLRARVDQLSGVLDSASSSDGVVRAKYGEWESRILILGSDEQTLNNSVPSLANVDLFGGAPTGQAAHLRTLRKELDELDDLKATRRQITSDAKYAVTQDDIKPVILREASHIAAKLDAQGGGKIQVAQFEDLFGIELGKFRKFTAGLLENGSRQEDLLNRIRSANDAFIQSRRADASMQLRAQALQDLETAYHMYQEISTNLREGLKFYSDFAKLLTELRDACKRYAYGRNAEAQEQQDLVTHALGRMRLSSGAAGSPGPYDPSKDGPIRFG